jgi:hypothetical protein
MESGNGQHGLSEWQAVDRPARPATMQPNDWGRAKGQQEGKGDSLGRACAVTRPRCRDSTADKCAIAPLWRSACASISIISSHEELMTKLGMSFEAQGRYGLVSASAKVEFSESSTYNSTSTFLVARCVVRNPFRRGRTFA